MTPQELGTKTRKIITTFGDQALINSVYFNPMFATKLMDRVDELKKIGIHTSKTETESAEGRIISAMMSSTQMEDLSLGSILLDGKDLVIQNTLVLLDELISYIESSAPEVF